MKELIVDDFLIHGKDQLEVDEKLKRVLDKSRDKIEAQH